MNNCPTATPEQRAAAIKRVRRSSSKETTQAKTVLEEGRIGGQTALMEILKGTYVLTRGPSELSFLSVLCLDCKLPMIQWKCTFWIHHWYSRWLTELMLMMNYMSALRGMFRDAEANGFTARLMPRLRSIVLEYRDIWRITIGPDDAARQEPYSVTLEKDAQPFRCKVRKYPELQNQFLSEYVEQLEKFGFVRRNDHSKWCCAAVPVKKNGSTTEFRITTDYRPVNRKTIPIAGVTPNLAVVTTRVQGATSFGTFDLFKGFWQMPLAKDSQEIFSFSTGGAVYSPTRVPRGAMDSALHFQTQMQDVFRDMLYESVFIWIDDIALYAKDDYAYLDRLVAFLQVLREYNLKLNAKNVCYSAERSIGVEKLSTELVCSMTRLGSRHCARLHFQLRLTSFSTYYTTLVVLPLQQLLTEALQGKSRKKLLAEGYFQIRMPPFVLFTDASHFGWAVVLTQVTNWQVDMPVHEQVHELVVSNGGTFKDAQLNWSVIEKEAYPIIRACTDLEYLLRRKNGFRLYCDHANLIKGFCPDQEMKQHIRGKLRRWAMRLTGYNYKIEHIVGTDNVWADLASRWGPYHSSEGITAVKRVRTRSTQTVSTLRPLEDEKFVWPSRDKVIEQQKQWYDGTIELVAADDGALYAEARLWILSQAKPLIQCLLVIAHCGIQSHRGEQVVVTHLNKYSSIENVAKLVKRFLRSCLLCKHVKGGKLIQRPWSDPAEIADRNEVLHVDFLSMGETYNYTRYLLVLKDELTHFCEWIACDSGSSEVAAAAVLDWAKRFGLPAARMSDQGSHFKDQVLEELSRRVDTLQRFAPIYTPRVNGTVERLNQDILQVFRALLMEWKLDTKK
ncbi:Hypothetical protein PHPALM_6568 [Phytophthora palmivora]|uniref:Integrase catalytic domain-containing protein n=1 Tax=Phytophthora palmivora TaxID=4796 RepID=A0A2P4YEK4_9STRA|nr:Hypothetical protein PHPALM_6568 [Phytophthora palmivora]